MLADVTLATFQPHLGTGFTIEVEGGEPLVLTLAEVNAHSAGHDLRAEPFTLVFEGPPDRMAPQATLTLAHEVLGPMTLLLVPVEPGRYEAVFN